MGGRGDGGRWKIEDGDGRAHCFVSFPKGPLRTWHSQAELGNEDVPRRGFAAQPGVVGGQRTKAELGNENGCRGLTAPQFSDVMSCRKSSTKIGFCDGLLPYRKSSPKDVDYRLAIVNNDSRSL